MDVVLRTNDPSAALAFRSVERAGKSGFCTTLEVSSRGFELRQLLCFEVPPLTTFIRELVTMDRELKGSATLTPLYEKHFIELSLTHRGRVLVRGAVFEYSDKPQELHFAFETDQTVLKPLIAELEQCAQLVA